MKPTPHLVHTLAGLALLCSVAAQAQGIWRCGPQGNSFSDRPCADGQVLSKPPPPSALAVQQAAEVARREAALAQQLRAQRLEQEQSFQRAQARLQRASQQASALDSRPGRPGRKTSERAAAALQQRVALAPAEFSRRAASVQARPATADARTSPAVARGFPASRD